MTRSHPNPEHPADCFGCKLASIQYGAVPGGARDRAAVERNREKSWTRDMAGYKSLREQGVQPPGIEGSADLAITASDQWEVEKGIVLSKDLQRTHLSALKDAEASIEKAPAREWAPAS